ncbi:MAG: hypothetical protein ABIN97_15965 [Ginsengibacter sp.]
MKNNSELNNKLDNILNSINKIKPAVPSPYFYTKVLAKINHSKPTIWEVVSALFLRPTIAFATICFIIAVNAFVLYSKIDNAVSSAGQSELALSDEYNETATALYYLENEKP